MITRYSAPIFHDILTENYVDWASQLTDIKLAQELLRSGGAHYGISKRRAILKETATRLVEREK